MPGDAAHALDAELPLLRPDVVEGYRSAAPHLVAEVIDGELSLMTRPRPRHGRSAMRLGTRLAAFDDPGAGDPGGWVILPEPELWLGPRPDIVVPDLAGWRRERVPEDFLDPAGVGIRLPPDWVCEVLSPSTEKLDRGRKLDLFHREGVRHVWLLSPVLRTLEVFRRADIGWLLVGVFDGAAPVRAEPFDAVPLDLAGLWTA